MENKILPKHCDYLVIGAGIHGLSTAMFLAKNTNNKKIVVIDKDVPGAGASGVACGVVRNNYSQSAMREVMIHSVDIWERYAKQLHYYSVGYLQISFEDMKLGVSKIYNEQKKLGYESTFIDNAKDSDKYMKNIFSDWRAKNITSVLHEKRGGYANNGASIEGLVKMVSDAGVEIVNKVEVKDFNLDSTSQSVKSVVTNQGIIECEQVVVAVGPWVKNIWDMLELPKKTIVKNNGIKKEENTWSYWMLQEGVLKVDTNMQKDNSDGVPPVVHVDTDASLYSDITGEKILDVPWGIYYKPDAYLGGIQGGFSPYPLEESPDEVAVDPYAFRSKKYLVGEKFIELWCSALAFCQERFSGLHAKYDRSPSGGLGCVAPDNFPIFDRFKDNVYFICDSNHGYKMIGIGELVSRELLGSKERLLEPFRYSRFGSGNCIPLSKSPFPWS